jgi:hypothetical protein
VAVNPVRILPPKDLAALEREEPAFRLFTDVFSRFIIRGTVQPDDLDQVSGKDPAPAETRRKVTFAVQDEPEVNTAFGGGGGNVTDCL